MDVRRRLSDELLRCGWAPDIDRGDRSCARPASYPAGAKAGSGRNGVHHDRVSHSRREFLLAAAAPVAMRPQVWTKQGLILAPRTPASSSLVTRYGCSTQATASERLESAWRRYKSRTFRRSRIIQGAC